MNVLTLASRKGGTGKSLLAAHLSAVAHMAGHACALIDTDPQGSLTLWHTLRAGGGPRLQGTGRGLAHALAEAAAAGAAWVFIDTPPTIDDAVAEAIGAATLVVIPARPALFDVAAARATVAVARAKDKPYAVVLNLAPARRDEKESPVVTQARGQLDRLAIPVWAGQITQRVGLALALGAGTGINEAEPGSAAAAELARLWSAVERSVAAINGAHPGGGMHRAA